MDNMLTEIDNIITRSNEERESSPSGCIFNHQVSMKAHDDIMSLLERPFVKKYMETEQCYLVGLKPWGSTMYVEIILNGFNKTYTIHQFYESVFNTLEFNRLETLNNIINDGQ